MPSPTIRCRMQDVRVPVVCVCNHILKVCEHDVTQTACANFTNFTINKMQLGTTINWLDLRSKGQRLRSRWDLGKYVQKMQFSGQGKPVDGSPS